MRRMAIGLLAALMAGQIGGCGGSDGGSGGSPSPGAASPTPAAATAQAVRIEINLSDFFSIHPNPITVPAGASITFVVHNEGTLEHEFFLGDAAAQAAREAELSASSLAADAGPLGIIVAPGSTRELTVTLEATGLIAGCHIPGHYGRGMHATIELTD